MHARAQDQQLPGNQGPSISTGGIKIYRPGTWGVVAIDARNHADETAVIETSFHFPHNPQYRFVPLPNELRSMPKVPKLPEFEPDRRMEMFRFTRQLWLPPNSRRLALGPVVTPDAIPDRAFELQASARRIVGQTVTPLKFNKAVTQSIPLPIPPDNELSASFSDETRSPETEAIYNALIATRLSQGYSRSNYQFNSTLLPGDWHALDCIDQLLIHNDVAFTDQAMMEAIRRWLTEGGRLWIMLDRVGVERTAEMLGHEFQCTSLGSVPLTTVEFEAERPNYRISPGTDYEQPPQLLRVMVENVDVLYRVDGWPVAFTQKFGRGRVLFTTLGAAAWIRPATGADAQSEDPLRRADFLPLPELQQIAAHLNQRLPPPPIRPASLRQYLGKRIGYQIVPRLPILSLLTAYVGALVIAGAVFWRQGRQARLAWVAPLLSLLAAVPIAVLAKSTQKSIPKTVAEAQVIAIQPQSDEAHVSGELAIYLQQPEDVPIGGKGGAFVPDYSKGDAILREILWTDYDEWKWLKLRLPAGVQTGNYTHVARLETPCRVTATFDEQGLVGQVSGGGWRSFEDPILVVPVLRGLSVTIDDEGRLRARPDGILGPDQFIASRIVNDEQRRRQQLLREASESWDANDLFPVEPTLMFWTEPLDAQLQLPEDAQRTGVALVHAPIAIHRPASQTEVAIPSSFLPFRTVVGPGDTGLAATYEDETGEWVPHSSPTDTWLRFQVPKTLLPLTARQLEIHLQINAPSRTLRILGLQNGQVVEVARRSNPSGALEFSIDRPELLEIDEEGGLMIGLQISQASSEQSQRAQWQIHDFQVTLRGIVQ